MACDVEALSTPIRPCSAGYYCRISANMTTPDIGILANECPAGSYCGEGTDEPEECPAGTFNPAIGRMSISECLNCTGGYFCNETGMHLILPKSLSIKYTFFPGLIAVVGQCEPGHYCPEGSSSPTELLCPMGYYCGLGTEYPAQCPNGTYSNQTGIDEESDCMQCTPGMYCDGFALVEPTGPCDPGIYSNFKLFHVIL